MLIPRRCSGVQRLRGMRWGELCLGSGRGVWLFGSVQKRWKQSIQDTGVQECRTTANKYSPSAPQPIFHQADLRDPSAIDAIFSQYDKDGGIWAVVHLAALKAVGESGEIPVEYYKVNVGGSVALLDVSTIATLGKPTELYRSCRNTTAPTWSFHPLPQCTARPPSFPFPSHRRYSPSRCMGGQRPWWSRFCRMCVWPRGGMRRP